MLYFPRLRTGAIAQLPFQKTVALRTLLNSLPDGSTISAADSSFIERTYDLSLSGLTLDEVNAMNTLFQSAEGKLNSFSFVDPAANLLCWSSDLTQACWNRDPQLVVTPAADAFGGSTGAILSNGGQTSQCLSQSVNAPSALTYTFSAYLRCDTNATAELSIGGFSLTAVIGSAWRRWSVPSSGGNSSGIPFTLSIPAGQSVQACGLQAEAQPCAGAYKATTSRGGAYPTSRFDQDTLAVAADGTGNYSCKVRVLARS